MTRIDARVIGLTLVLLVAAVPAVTASYHGDSPDTTSDPCPTDPAFNATGPQLLPADASGQDAVHVDVVDFEPFDPALLEIDAGTCVEWENHGDVGHTIEVAASSASPGSTTFVGEIAPGEMVHHVFEEPGTYYVHCEVNAFHEATMHQVARVS